MSRLSSSSPSSSCVGTNKRDLDAEFEEDPNVTGTRGAFPNCNSLAGTTLKGFDLDAEPESATVPNNSGPINPSMLTHR